MTAATAGALTGDTSFQQALTGRFQGVLRWEDFDALWRRLAAAPEGWHVYDTETVPPEAPAAPAQLEAAMAEASTLMDEVRARRDVCGAVYVDDMADPAFIKVFDPFNMGSSCGGGGAVVRPRWLITRMRPEALPEPAPEEKPRDGLVARLFGRR